MKTSSIERSFFWPSVSVEWRASTPSWVHMPSTKKWVPLKWCRSTATNWMNNFPSRNPWRSITAPGEIQRWLGAILIFQPNFPTHHRIPQPPASKKKSGRISARTSTRWELPSIRWILISKLGVGNAASLEEAAKDLQTLSVLEDHEKLFAERPKSLYENLYDHGMQIYDKNNSLEGKHLRNGGLFKQYMLCPMLCLIIIVNTMSIRITSC